MVTLAGVKMAATLRLRSNFAVNHLIAAAKSARLAHEIESIHKGEPFGPWFDGMMREVPVAVIMSSAPLEASANECLQDILDGTGTNPLPTSSRTRLLKELRDDRSGNALVKFRRMALLLDKEPPEKRDQWRNAELLVQFRNMLLHFRPAWDDDAIHGENAKWAVESVVMFSTEYAQSVGVADKFASSKADFALPH
jgi:hypothetical protein